MGLAKSLYFLTMLFFAQNNYMMDTIQKVKIIAELDNVHSLCFSNKTNSLIVGCYKEINFFKKIKKEYSLEKTLSLPSNFIMLTPDEEKIVTYKHKQSPIIQIINLQGKVLKNIEIKETGSHAINIGLRAPFDKAWLGMSDGNVICCDLTSQDVSHFIKRSKEDSSFCSLLAFRDDNKLITALGKHQNESPYSNELSAWDLKTKQKEVILTLPFSIIPIRNAISCNGRYIATQETNGTLYVIDTIKKQILFNYPEDPINAPCITDNNFLIMATGSYETQKTVIKILDFYHYCSKIYQQEIEGPKINRAGHYDGIETMILTTNPGTKHAHIIASRPHELLQLCLSADLTRSIKNHKNMVAQHEWIFKLQRERKFIDAEIVGD